MFYRLLTIFSRRQSNCIESRFILSLCELIVGNKDGLRPVEKTVIDCCIRQIYQKYFEKPGPKSMPILGDLYEALFFLGRAGGKACGNRP